jgi:hypothetical protein
MAGERAIKKYIVFWEIRKDYQFCDWTIRVGDHRWIIATDYGDGANMTRSGAWIPQRSGGWWTAHTLERAIKTSPDPVIYRTRKAAREALGRDYD